MVSIGHPTFSTTSISTQNKDASYEVAMISEKSDSASDQSPVQSRSASNSRARWYGDSQDGDNDRNGQTQPPVEYILPRSNKTSTSEDSDNDEINDQSDGNPTNGSPADESTLTDKVFSIY